MFDPSPDESTSSVVPANLTRRVLHDLGNFLTHFGLTHRFPKKVTARELRYMLISEAENLDPADIRKSVMHFAAIVAIGAAACDDGRITP